MYPDDLKYTREHEWVRTEGDTLRIGITDFAQDALGDIVFVTLPEPGTAVEVGQSLGEVESTKSVSDVYAPLAGTIVRRNEALDDQPELINSDPYGEGWMIELRPADPGAVDGLLDAAAYQQLAEEG
ncbi:MAG: glycine cleavage system protein GcvH [Frankiaceae bacterium]